MTRDEKRLVFYVLRIAFLHPSSLVLEREARRLQHLLFAYIEVDHNHNHTILVRNNEIYILSFLASESESKRKDT